MQRRKFSRELKLAAVRLVKDRGVAVAQAACDLDLRENVLRKGSARRALIRSMPFPLWADEAGAARDRPAAQGSRQLKAERDILKKGRSLLREGSDVSSLSSRRNIWPVAWLCDALDVSRSGFRTWSNRSPATSADLRGAARRYRP